MTTSGITKCSVPGCSGSVDGYSDNHRVPGAIVAHGESAMVITNWVAEHNGEVGFIFLNDYALGDLFGGRGGFELKLAQQRFTKVRNVDSLLEKSSAFGMKNTRGQGNERHVRG
jgi:hypothetical protein